MRHYIGNRLVEAEEAVRIYGKVYTYDGPIPKAMNREEGYKVYYPDGYETFMKKEYFEKIYHLHEREELAKAAEEQGCTTCEECCDCCGDPTAGSVNEETAGPEELPQTIRMMLSDDFKERTKAEYWQLKIRLDKLKAMCKKYAAGELTFKPNCPLELLKDQVTAMDLYLSILEDRAKIENIDLNKVDVPTVHIYKQGTDEKTKDRECTPPPRRQ